MEGKRKRPKILIADADPRHVALLSGILGDKDYDLQSSGDGSEAVDRANAFQPDLIILNSGLPGMDVYEVTKRVKAERETCIIPIVLLVPVSGPCDKKKGLDAGVDDFISEPIDGIELLARVQSLVKLKKLQDRLRAKDERAPFSAQIITAAPNRARNLVLIVETDGSARPLYDSLLRSCGFDILTTSGGGDALTLAEKNQPDLILLDLGRTHADCLEFLSNQKERPALRDIPVIICSSNTDPDARIGAIEAGAVDYLVKPVNPNEMLARVNSTLRKGGDRKKLKSDMDSLFEQSVMDPLTGLYNRRYLKTVIDNDMAAAKRYNRSIFVIMLDIDDFKTINDTCGHLAGDGVLKAMGGILRMRLRSCDIAARYGGDEFVVLLTDNNMQGVRVFAERMRATVDAHRFAGVGDRKITVSIGVAEYDAKDENMESVIKKADDALYAAKQAGKNRVI